MTALANSCARAAVNHIRHQQVQTFVIQLTSTLGSPCSKRTKDTDVVSSFMTLHIFGSES